MLPLIGRPNLMQHHRSSADAKTDDEKASSFSRYKGIVMSGGMAGLAKSIQLASILISVPLTIDYLGLERFGMWMTISSFVTLLAFADMGIGNGLVTLISKHHGKDDTPGMIRQISGSFFLLLLISMAVMAVFIAIYPLIDWARVFSVQSELAENEAPSVVLALVVIFAITLPLGVVQRVQMGLQEGWIMNLWQAGGYIAGLIGVVACIKFEAGLLYLVIAISGGPAFALLLNGVVEVTYRRPVLRPSIEKIDKSSVRGILKVGSYFFGLQICSIIGMSIDNMMITYFHGPEEVAPYAVMYKYFQVSLVFGLFTQPLWAAFGEAIARGDHRWVRAAFYKSLAISMGIGAALALTTIFFGQDIIYLWVGSEIHISDSMMYGFAAQIFLISYIGIISSFLNNGDLIRKQFKFYALASFAALTLKFVIIDQWSGSGAVWATVFSYATFYAIPAAFIAMRYIKETHAASSEGNIAEVAPEDQTIL